MKSDMPSFLLNLSPSSKAAHTARRGGGRVDMSYLEKGIKGFAELFTEGYAQWDLSSKKSFLHDLDARIKIVFWILLIVVISLKRVVLPEVAIFLFIFTLAAFSRLNLIDFYKKVLVLGFVFGFLVSAPSALNAIVPGRVIMPLIILSRPYEFWIYHVPQTVGITEEGIAILSLLTLRVLNSLSISFLILYTTPFADIIKALKVIKVPDTFLIIISMTYKYIFTFAHIVSDMHLAKKARLAGVTGRKEARKWIAGRIAFVFKKTQIECDEVFKAMMSRGFSGEIRLYHYRQITGREWATGLCLIALGIVCLFV
jgi:energy-coupling factor transporter transmembrane protein EcfT